MKQSLSLHGYFLWTRYDSKRRFRGCGRIYNMVTTAAINNLLDVYFNGASQTATWYMGLIDLASFTSIDAADTMSSHAGWQEVTTYSQSTRPSWGQAAAASGSINNPSAAQFTFTATKTIHGLFVASNNVKNGTTGILWNTAILDSNETFNAGELLKLFYVLPVGST